MLRLVQAASLSLLTLCPFILSAAEAYMFSVLAGSRVETYRDGPGRTAAFASPAHPRASTLDSRYQAESWSTASKGSVYNA